MSNRTRQNNKRADKKLESNDSPEIPDMEETSEGPGIPQATEKTEQEKVVIMLQKHITR